MKRLLGLALLLGPLVLATPLGAAHAGPKEDNDRALALFEEGKKAYQEGHFDDAIRLLKDAYSLKAEPVLLYNLARAHEGKGDLPAAVAAYEQYLAGAGKISDRGAIEKKVESLKALIAEKDKLERDRRDPATPSAPPVAPSAAPSKPETPKDAPARSPSPAPWVIAGVGAAGLIAGGVLGGLALSKNDEADTAASQQATADSRGTAETFALASTISLIAGGVVLAAGGIWGIVDVVASTKKPDGAAVRVRVGPGGVVVIASF